MPPESPTPGVSPDPPETAAAVEQIAQKHHVYGTSGFGPEQVACSCDRAWRSNGEHAQHVVEAILEWSQDHD